MLNEKIIVFPSFQVGRDLLSEDQSQVFIDMIREIVKQVKHNPKQIPVVQIPQKYRQVNINSRFVIPY